MTSREPIEEKLENLGQALGSDEKLVENVMSCIGKEHVNVSKSKPRNIWSIIMKKPVTKLAAAAALIIGVFVISLQFNNSGVAWGALVERIEGVQSVVYHLTSNTSMKGMPQELVPKTYSIAYYSSEYGSRSETYMNDKLSMIMYLNPKENVYLTVLPESKRFMKVTNKSQEELKQISDKDDPRVLVRQMMSEDYKELGRDRIDGIEVEGIECSGPRVMGGMFENATARLWVEVGTDFPVRLEIEGTVSGGQMDMIMVMEDFQWNADLDPALFVPDIPSDYTSQDINLPESNEGTLINGLRLFAELSDGRYPDSLVPLSLLKEVSEELTKKYGVDLIKKQDEYTSTLMGILPAGTFFSQLQATQKEVVYYGDTVTAADTNKVLLRWKVTEGVYRIIFADLSAGNFSAEELAELEK